MSIHWRFLFKEINPFDLDYIYIYILLIITNKSYMYLSLTVSIYNWACMSIWYFVISEFSIWVIIWSFLIWSSQFDQVSNKFWDEFWTMIICGLLVPIRHIHASDDGYWWWLMLFSWSSTFKGFIIIFILTWMGPLTYIVYGHMVYGYSFLVELDILIPLVNSVFQFHALKGELLAI